MNYSWGHNRRFNAYSNYFKKEFGERVQKVSIDAGFTCPNRDGSKSRGGCTFCNNSAFNPSYCKPEKSVKQQILEGIEFHETRYKSVGKYLAYFQAYSNTYDSLNRLKEIYDQALEVDQVIGLVIGTRPDCVDLEKLDYFQELAKKHYLVIEYGVESCNDQILEMINRGHTFQDSVNAIEETAKRGIKTGAHFIIGFPGESREDMLHQVDTISRLPLHSIKFHQLQLVRDTQMENDYLKHPEKFSFFQLDDYITFMVDFVERLNPDFVIERIAGEAPPDMQRTPVRWGLRNDQILQKFENKLAERESWQGRLFVETGG